MRHNKYKSRARYDQGFSLLEVLVVIVLFSTLAAMFNSISVQRVAKKSVPEIANDIVMILENTRSKSIRTRYVHKLVFSRMHDVLHIDVLGRKTVKHLVSLSESMRFSIIYGVAVDDVIDTLHHIKFYPTGGSSGGQIQLSLQGSESVIDVHWLDGTVTLK